MKKTYKRRKLWIHRSQTHLFLWICGYTQIYLLLAITLILFSHRLVSVLEPVLGEQASTFLYAFTPAVLVCLAFVFIYDSIRFVHRLVGPVYRFRQTIRAALDGEQVALVNLRQGDYLTEMQDDLNQLLVMLEDRGVIELKQPATTSKLLAAVV